MGCCISKCRPKKNSKYKEGCSLVQDKLVISQPPPSISPPIPLLITQKGISASSLSPTSSGVTSFSCTCSHGSTISCSSFSSTASSTLINSKEKSSFSNEFLWSCVKENPHIVRVDPVKESPAKHVHTRVHNAQKLDSPPTRQSIPQRVVRPTPPQKRARPNSPTITRQKSFRRETAAERSNRTLMRSPSPSRRFNGENLKNVVVPNTPRETCSRRAVGSRKGAVQPIVSSMRMENLRPASPSSNTTSSRHWRSLKDRDRWNYRIGSKIDEAAVGEVVTTMEIDSLPNEDINNPHISLDCFIFL